MGNIKSCRNCIHEPKGRYQYPCINCYEWSKHESKQKQTNADRIRNMTDEELADFLKTDVEICEEMGEKHNCQIGCKDCILQWLQAEVKEGDTDE